MTTKRSTTMTGAAGEHYVAYRLSQRGYTVALTRGGALAVDLMVANPNGDAVSVQVKTASTAYYPSVRNPDKSYWNWDVGEKARHMAGESLFYAFVDLKGDERGTAPDVFIVPAKHVAANLDSNPSRVTFSIMQSQKDDFWERWDLITERLGGKQEDTKKAAAGETS